MKKTMLFAIILLLIFAVGGFAYAGDTEPVPFGDVVGTLLPYLPESWESWVTLIVTFCAAISAVWARPADSAHPIIRLLYTLINALGFNAGRAKNADDHAAQVMRLKR